MPDDAKGSISDIVNTDRAHVPLSASKGVSGSCLSSDVPTVDTERAGGRLVYCAGGRGVVDTGAGSGSWGLLVGCRDSLDAVDCFLGRKPIATAIEFKLMTADFSWAALLGGFSVETKSSASTGLGLFG